jgi:Acetyltransferase (GNAT) domain
MRSVWDATVRRARARHFLFERDYMDYHADRFTDASWLVLRDGEPLGVLPASRNGSEAVSHGGLTFGGLLTLPAMTLRIALDALKAVSDAFGADDVRRLVYKPMPHLYHVAPADEDLYALHAAGARLVQRDVTAAVPPGIRPPYSEERRRAVRRGQQSTLTLDESDRIEEFMTLLEGVLAERHGLWPVHTPAEMRRLFDHFPGRIRLFVATTSGEIVAGTLIFETPTVAHAQYIANGPRGRELGAGDALFDHLLRTVYSDKWFDFGISNDSHGLNEGLMRNKEGFGARAVVHDRYALELA